MQFASGLKNLVLPCAICLAPNPGFGANDASYYRTNKSMPDAMAFIGIAADQHDKYTGSVSGVFPAGAEQSMADSLARVNAEKSVPRFLELIGKPSLEALKAHVGNDSMVDRIVGSIKAGTYLGAAPGTRVFATYKALSEAEKSRYLGHKGMKFDPVPNGIVTFFHFDQARKRLIGTRFEVHKSGNPIKLLLPAFSAGG